MRNLNVTMLVVFAAKRNTLVIRKYPARMSLKKDLSRLGENDG